MNKPRFEVVKSLQGIDGKTIWDLSDKLAQEDVVSNVAQSTIETIDKESKSAEDKIQAYMVKISELVFKFAQDKCKAKGVYDTYSIKITGDGQVYCVLLCNGVTSTIAGKTWMYDDFIKRAANNEIEVMMNGAFDKIIEACENKKPLDGLKPHWV